MPGFAADLAAALAPAVLLLVLIAAEAAQRARPGRIARWYGNVAVHVLGIATVFALAAVWDPEASLGTFPAWPWFGERFVATAQVAAIGFLDLVVYAVHRLQHRVPLLWRFHAVHHSDADVDASTAIRHHPGEAAVNYAVVAVVAASAGIPPETVTAYALLALCWQLIQHADIAAGWLSHPAVAALLVTPALHRRHHARDPAIAEANYGTLFSIWDRAFGSLRAGGHDAAFGVDGIDDDRRWRPIGMLLTPVTLAIGRRPR